MPTRRALLRAGLAGAATVATAGCAVPGVAPEDRPRLLRRWVPDPATLQPAAHGKVFYLDWTAVAGVSHSLAEGTYRKYRNYARFLGVARLDLAPGAVSELVQVYPPASSPRRAAVARLDHDLDQLRGRLGERYDRRARHEGVVVFWNDGGDDGNNGDSGDSDARSTAGDAPVEWGNRPVAVGVDGRHLVLGAPTPTRSGRAVVERVAGAHAGATTRYVEASAGLRAVLDALAGGDDVSAETYDRVAVADAAPEHARFAGAVAAGHRYRFGDRTTRSRYAFAFAGGGESGDDAATDDAAAGRTMDADTATADATTGGAAATDATTSGATTDGATAADAATGDTESTDAASAAAAAAVPAVQRWVEAHRDDRLFGAYRSVTVQRGPRTVVVDGELPTDEV